MVFFKKNRFEQSLEAIEDPAIQARVRSAFDSVATVHDWLASTGLKYSVSDIIELDKHLKAKLP
jgi:hypothetical protein